MKPLHIILLVVVAACIAMVVSTFSDSSTYVGFQDAQENPEKEYHVVGVLQKEKGIFYDPINGDVNHLEFYLADTLNTVRKVIYNKPKPADLEKSEKVVIVGKALGDTAFLANTILLKCPSKYNETEAPTEKTTAQN